MFDPIFRPFVEKSPISVMARGMLERGVNPDLLDESGSDDQQSNHGRRLPGKSQKGPCRASRFGPDWEADR